MRDAVRRAIDAAATPAANDNAPAVGDGFGQAVDALVARMRTRGDVELLLRELAARAMTAPVHNALKSALRAILGPKRPRQGKIGRPAHDDTTTIAVVMEIMRTSGCSRAEAIRTALGPIGQQGSSTEADFQRIRKKLQKYNEMSQLKSIFPQT